jgi:hypothetical protein
MTISVQLMDNITRLLCFIVHLSKHHTVNTFRDVGLKRFGLSALGKDVNSVKL